MTSFDAIRIRLRDKLRAYPFISGFLATILLSAPLVCCVILFVVATTLQQHPPTTSIATPAASATSVMSGTIKSPSALPSSTPTLVPQTTSPVAPTVPPTAYPDPGLSLPTRQFPTSTSYPYPNPGRPTPIIPTGYPSPGRPTPIIPTGYPTPGRPTPVTPTSYPAPSPQAIQSTAPGATPSPTPDLSDVLESSGIGLDQAIWEETQGSPVETEAGYSYKDGAFLVEFQDGAIWYLKRMWGDKDAVPLEDARGLARRFIPDDSDLIESGEDDDSMIIDVYHSEWLKEQFVSGDDIWVGGEPGDFTIVYTVIDGRTVSFVITPRATL